MQDISLLMLVRINTDKNYSHRESSADEAAGCVVIRCSGEVMKGVTLPVKQNCDAHLELGGWHVAGIRTFHCGLKSFQWPLAKRKESEVTAEFQ